MTPEEIKALIKAKIAGQGSAVDVGSALPAILEGIVDLATRKVLKVKLFTGTELTSQQAATGLGITTEELSEIFSYPTIKVESGGTHYYVSNTSSYDDPAEHFKAGVWGYSSQNVTSGLLEITVSDGGLWDIFWSES